MLLFAILLTNLIRGKYCTSGKSQGRWKLRKNGRPVMKRMKNVDSYYLKFPVRVLHTLDKSCHSNIFLTEAGAMHEAGYVYSIWST